MKARLPAMDGSQCSTPPYFKTPDGQPLRFTMGASVWLAGRPSHRACFTDSLLSSSCTCQLPIALESCFLAMHAAYARAIKARYGIGRMMPGMHVRRQRKRAGGCGGGSGGHDSRGIRRHQLRA